MTLDRIDGTKGYIRGNVKWSTPREQKLNTTSTIWIKVDGTKMCLKDAAKLNGINYRTLLKRYEKGERSADRLFRPVLKKVKKRD